MKTIIVACLIFALASCSNSLDKNVSTDFTWNANDSLRTYVDAKGTSLIIMNTSWHTSTKWGTLNLNGFGKVYVIMTGSTNADKVVVRNYGDGLINDQNIMLDSNESFNKDTVGISFSHFSGPAPSEEFERSTVIRAYRGSDTLTITMNSGKLKY